MRRLRFLIAGRRADGERGAVLVLTAVLVSFVAIGLLALTVDLGNITYNRAQLQNGADATSLALAAACAQPSATAPCAVTTSLTTLAAKNANAAGQSMSINTAKTCIGGAAYTGTTTLPSCPATENTAALSNCQAWPLSVPSNTVSYVEVSTQTQMTDGSKILPFDFGQLLGAGNGTTQQTCSRAAWGAAGSTGNTLPITMGLCEWINATNSGKKYAAVPPYSVAPGSSTGSTPPMPSELLTPTNYAVAIYAHGSSSTSTCPGSPSGSNYPGGFGWLTTSGGCTAQIGVGDNVGGSTGRSVPGDCKSGLQPYVGTVVTIPIFDSTSGNGSGGAYHIAGVASFYLAGYAGLPSAKPKTYSVYQDPGVCTGKCNGSVSYLWGWFVSSLLPVGSTTISTAPNMGANVIVPAG